MKQKFLKDLGLDISGDTEDLLQEFNLTGYMDQISDNRLKEEAQKVEELKDKVENEDSKEN